MSDAAALAVAVVFLLFCRVGGCLMLMPGFSSPRVPPQIRLFIAISITLALAPLLYESVGKALPNLEPQRFALLIATETMTGAVIGMTGRIFFMALQFAGTAIAMFIGFGAVGDVGVDTGEPQPAIATLLTITATVLVFISDLHWEMLRGLVASYSVLPVSEPFEPRFALSQLADTTAEAFVLALRITSPFIVFSIAVNLLFGLANKLTPQIPVYFISMPFVLAGGLMLLHLTSVEVLRLFNDQFLAWLRTGG